MYENYIINGDVVGDLFYLFMVPPDDDRFAQFFEGAD